MQMRANYQINTKTVVLEGIYYKNGRLFTAVVEGEVKFLVAKSPIEIIEHSLICYGSNFDGALKSSKQLLGDHIKLHPIKISGSLDIWIFPTKAHKDHNCIWFVLNHVKDTECLGVKHTRVFLSHEHTFEIRMRESSFKIKRSNAKDLRDKINGNMQYPNNFLMEPRKGFCLVESKGDYKFAMKDDE